MTGVISIYAISLTFYRLLFAFLMHLLYSHHLSTVHLAVNLAVGQLIYELPILVTNVCGMSAWNFKVKLLLLLFLLFQPKKKNRNRCRLKFILVFCFLWGYFYVFWFFHFFFLSLLAARFISIRATRTHTQKQEINQVWLLVQESTLLLPGDSDKYLSFDS